MMDLIKIDTQKNAHYPMPSRFIARGMSREHFTKLVEELSFGGSIQLTRSMILVTR